MSKQSGFTLTELLIALVLLGVIASFAIPKVLKATADQRKGAIIREAVSMLEDAYYGNRVEGDNFATATDLYNYIINDINFIQSGTGDAGTAFGGAFDTAATACSDNVGYILLPNGAIIAGLVTDAAGDYHQICIDVDGVGGLNTIGTDQFVGTFVHHATGKSFYWAYGTCTDGTNTDCAAGEVGVHDGTTADAGTAGGAVGDQLTSAAT